MVFEKLKFREIYYTIYSRKQGEKKYDEFIDYIITKYCNEISELGYEDMRDQIGVEIDEVLRLENSKNICEENFTGLLELKVLSNFVNWEKSKTTKYYPGFDYREEIYIGKLNSNGRKLIKEWNKFLANSLVKEYN